MKYSPEKQEIRRKDLFKIKRLQLHPDTEKIIKNAVHDFTGNGVVLESAIGELFIGQFYGWRILLMVHGSTTYINMKKYLE